MSIYRGIVWNPEKDQVLAIVEVRKEFYSKKEVRGLAFQSVSSNNFDEANIFELQTL